MALAQQKSHRLHGDRRMFSSLDDSGTMQIILATHSPDGRNFDVSPLLDVVEDVLHRATPSIVGAPQAQIDMEEKNTNQNGVVGILEALAYTIHRISCEITCKCTGGGEPHETTMAVFNTLSSYSWDAKVVMALAAFAVSYGEFWLLAQLHTVNPLAKSVGAMKQVPQILEHSEILKPRFDSLNILIKAMLDVTKCIIAFTKLPAEYITPETDSMTIAMTHIPTAVYWTIRSVVACASQIISLIGIGHEYIASTTEVWELSSLAHKVNNIHEHLLKQLNLCHQHIAEKKHIEAYQKLVRLFESVHIDNMKILKTIIYSEDDLPLVDGTTKTRVNVDVLRRKTVILLISELDISNEEVYFLAQIYNDKQQGRLERYYEVVWLPVTDRGEWTEAKQDAFNKKLAIMPWYSLYHPSLLDPAVIKYIRDVWHFDKKPLLVVLDPQGKVVCPNAFHMMWIWRSQAYPFSSIREEALWKEETWRLEFLVDEIDLRIFTWVKEGRFVCLYGGEDIEWIRRFTTVMKRVAQEARIALEMIYIGKSNPNHRVRRVTNTIAEENLSGYWQDPGMMWFFWVRLESMWHSKMQLGRTIENDPIMQEVMTMLSFDGSNEGWALISPGGTEIVKSHGKKIVDCLTEYDTWKESVEHEGFLPALENALLPYQTLEHCTRLILPGNTGKLPMETVVCAECKRPMEKYILYRCCTD